MGLDGVYKYECTGCRRVKAWYNFKLPIKDTQNLVCFNCIRRREASKVHLKLNRLIDTCMKNKMTDLRNHLFETLENVKDGTMQLDRAKAVCEIAQVIINSVRTEIEFLKVTGSKVGTGFLQIESET